MRRTAWSPRLAVRCCLFAIALAVPLSDVMAQPELIQLMSNGPTDQRVNVVLLSEGYTADELPDFQEDAADILAEMLSTPPYDAFSTYFNGFAISVASPESGSDHPSRNEFRDTYFSSYYDCANITRLICVAREGSLRIVELLQDLMPEYDIVLLVVNDEEYGGSGGSIAVTSVHPAAPEIAIHEVGHSFARLADEYGGNELAGRESANTTQETRRQHVRWGHWIRPDTPIPTPDEDVYHNVTGLFEGAAYADVGWYRPQYQCKMRALGVPFCHVCAEHHVGAIYNLVAPISSSAPAERDLVVNHGDTLQLRVEPMAPVGRHLDVEWFVNGTRRDTADPLHLSLPSTGLPEGTSLVEVRVTDGTELVRDPSLLPLLGSSVEWEVTMAAGVGVADSGPELTNELGAAYPNPAVSEEGVSFSFRLSRSGHVSLKVFDVVGREVVTVVSETISAGAHEVRRSLPRLTPGVYFYRFQTDDYHATRKLVVVG